MTKLTFGSRVVTCEAHTAGRITMIWPAPMAPARQPPYSPIREGPWPYYRVQFPPRSPFLDDYAVFRAYEVALYSEDQPPMTNLQLNQLMRPKPLQ